MHLDIGLPLLSETEQLCRAFWKNYNNQSCSDNQDNNSSNPTPCPQPQRERLDNEQCWDRADNHTEPKHLSLSHDQNSAPDTGLDRLQHTHHNHDMKSEQDHSTLSEEFTNNSQDKSLYSRSTNTDSKNGCEICGHNIPSQPLQVLCARPV